jgi:MFS family permease
VNFALNGEWSLGSTLVAETWPARLRGRVISFSRATWCLGVALAGSITGIVAATRGWRVAVMVAPGGDRVAAIYVRAICPESPYWVRAQYRKRRIAKALSAGRALNENDHAWYAKAGRVDIRQVVMPDVLPVVASFVACSSCCIFGTVVSWMPYYLSVEKYWSTQEYSAFYVCWGILGFLGLCLAGWLADRIGRRVGFIAMLIEGAVFMVAMAAGVRVLCPNTPARRSSIRSSCEIESGGCIPFASSCLHAYQSWLGSSRGPSAHGLDGLFAPPPGVWRGACRQWRPGPGRHQLLEDGFQRGEPWGIGEASIFDRLLQQADQRRLFFVAEFERRHSRFPRRGVG